MTHQCPFTDSTRTVGIGICPTSYLYQGFKLEATFSLSLREKAPSKLEEWTASSILTKSTKAWDKKQITRTNHLCSNSHHYPPQPNDSKPRARYVRRPKIDQPTNTRLPLEGVIPSVTKPCVGTSFPLYCISFHL